MYKAPSKKSRRIWASGVWYIIQPNHQSSRWVLDLDKFNEWMNEIDYEIEEEDDQEGRAGRRRRKPPASPKAVEPKPEKPKRKETGTPSALPEAKRQRRRGRTKEQDGNSVDEDDEIEAVASEDEAPSTPLKAPTPKPSAAAAEPPKKEETPKPAATPSPAPPKVSYQRVTAPPVRTAPDPATYITTPKPTPVAAKPKATKTITNISQHVAPEADTFTITINPDNKSIIIPPQSSWFSMGQIHPLEQRAVPEFFQGLGSKTPDLYKDYRDFMIMAYNQNPGQYLTLTACRRNLAGDVGSILRVHTFLEHWGLINNGVQPISKVLPLPPLQEVRQKPITLDDILLVKSSTPNLATHSIKIPVPVPPPNKSVHCDHCKTECTDYSYESERIPDHKVVLCVTCYHSGHYDSSLSAADFYRTRRDSFVSVEWTEAETLRLLDGLEQFQEDWNRVAQHVGTKTPEQCLQQFLSMPIEDPYFKPSIPSGPLEAGEVVASIDLALKSGTLPFNGAPNPVLALLSFLAHGTTPQIASAAAKAALHAYKDDVDAKVRWFHLLTSLAGC